MSETMQRRQDAQWLEAFCQGDKNAALHLTSVYGPKAYAQAFRRLANAGEAEEVAQEALLKLWKVAPEWQAEKAQISTWLYRVVENLCTDILRKRRGSIVGLDAVAEPPDLSATSLDQIQTKGRVAALYAAMRQLPDAQREAIEMRHLEGFSNTEIAKATGQTVRAVESLTARAKRKLASLLMPKKEALGYEDESELG